MEDSGYFREVHDLCVLLGYGADAICPYLVFETLSMLRKEGKLMPFMNDQDIYLSYIAATARGISKVMAKMGISTLQSYKVKTPFCVSTFSEFPLPPHYDERDESFSLMFSRCLQILLT